MHYIIKLNNYVVQLLAFTSVPAKLGSRKIFLLLNDSSHDPHFLAYQNIETLDDIQKISNFSLYGFFRYLTPNMALQKIILISFFFLFLLSDRGLCVLRAITSRRYWAIGTKFCKHAQGWMLLYLTLFGFIWSRGIGVRGPQSWRILPCYFRQDFEIFKFSHELYFVESK